MRGLFRPPSREMGAAGRAELIRLPAPATRLDARDRDHRFALCRNHDRQVDDAVLLGADQLLAVLWDPEPSPAVF